MTDYKYIKETGVIIPDTSDILDEVNAEWRTAIGQDLSVDPNTPQGTLIAGEVLSRTTLVRNNAQLANQINPNESGGIFLESTCAWFGIERDAAQPTVIPGVRLGGKPLTFIPSGSRGRTINGDLFYTANDVSTNTQGVAIVDMVAVNTGPIAVPVGYLNAVVDTILGWETIINPNAGVIGRNQQSDTNLRLVRSLRVARQGISTVEAQISGLYDVDGVHSLAFRENISELYMTIDGIYMKPHSVWACVRGGVDSDIARSLLKNKTDGAGWNGDISVSIIEPFAGQPYTIFFDRPTEVEIVAIVTVKKAQGVADPMVVVPQSIVDYAAGEIEGERGFIVGQNVSPFELAGAISINQPGFFVVSVLIAKRGETPSPVDVPITLKEIPTITFNDIQVVIAQ